MLCNVDLDDVGYESDTKSVIFNDKYDENDSDNYSRALSFISSKNSDTDSFCFSYNNSYNNPVKNYSKS